MGERETVRLSSDFVTSKRRKVGGLSFKPSAFMHIIAFLDSGRKPRPGPAGKGQATAPVRFTGIKAGVSTLRQDASAMPDAFERRIHGYACP
jgi:hypothetical protein